MTGGIGFIGSHLVENLIDRECARITVYDNYDDFYPGKEENARILINHAKESETKFEIIRGDITDYSNLSRSMRNSEVVFHLAAQAGVRYCNDDPIKANRVNVDGTINLLLAAREHKIRKMVCASSSSIFGDPIYLPIDEEHPTNPNSPYGVSKLAAEQYCKIFSRVYGTNAVCLRYFSVYGPRGRPDQVIYAFAESTAKGKQPRIFGTGEQTRDFTYVSDVVDATVLAMVKEVKSGEVFNIGHGSRVTINQLANKVISTIGKASASISPSYEETSRGDFPDTEANNEKARRLLEWNPRVDVDEGLGMFFDWFVNKRFSALC